MADPYEALLPSEDDDGSAATIATLTAECDAARNEVLRLDQALTAARVAIDAARDEARLTSGNSYQASARNAEQADEKIGDRTK